MPEDIACAELISAFKRDPKRPFAERLAALHRSSRAVRQRLADFPMVSKRIDDSSDAPTIWLVADGPNNGGSCCDGPFESGIRIFHDHHYPHRTTAERLWTEVEVLR